MTSKPVKPVQLSPRHVKRVLAWAQAEGSRHINEMERELATHLALIDTAPSAAEQKIPHEWAKMRKTRSVRVEELLAQISLSRATFYRLLDLIEQLNNADMEKDAEEIVSSMLAQRRAEEKVKEDKRTVEGEKL